MTCIRWNGQNEMKSSAYNQNYIPYKWDIKTCKPSFYMSVNNFWFMLKWERWQTMIRKKVLTLRNNLGKV